MILIPPQAVAMAMAVAVAVAVARHVRPSKVLLAAHLVGENYERGLCYLLFWTVFGSHYSEAVAAVRPVRPTEELLAAQPVGENYKRVLRFSFVSCLDNLPHHYIFTVVAAPLLVQPRKALLAAPLVGRR